MRFRVTRALLVALTLAAASPAFARDDLDTLLSQVAAGPGAVREHAIDRLAYLGPHQAGPGLIVLLQSPSESARVGASEALVVVRVPMAAVALRAALADEDWEVRRNAAQALGALASPGAGRRLAKALLHDAEVQVRLACAAALARTGGGGWALARAAARDPSLEVRLTALDALAHRPAPSQAPHLWPLLADRTGLVRFAAARALAWSGDRRGRAFLARALFGRDSDDRARAVTVLADSPTRWARDQLAHALATKDIALAAASALATRGDRRGIVALVRMSEGGPEASAALAKLDELNVPLAERADLSRVKP